jgi:hypothetical protein
MSGILVGGDLMGYSWSGTLSATDLRSVYDRCAALRFTGLVDLVDGARRAQAVFIGGELVEVRGATDDEVQAFRGAFHATQRVPDLAGLLTDGIRFEGGLRQETARDLIRHCQDNRLSADLELARINGERAELVFSNGRLESVLIAGKKDLSGLGRVSGWRDGTYKIALRPLFTDESSRAATPPPRRAPDPSQLFDVTAQVSLPDARALLPQPPPAQPTPSQTPARERPPELVQTVLTAQIGSPARERPQELVQTVPMGTEMPSILAPPPELPDPEPEPPPRPRTPSGPSVRVSVPDAPGLETSLPDGERTAITRAPPPARSGGGVDETSMVRMPSERRRSSPPSWLPMAVLGLGIFALVAVGTVWLLRPAPEPPTVEVERPKPPPPPPPTHAVPRPPPPAHPAAPPPPPVEQEPQRPAAERALIDKGRRLLVEGHRKAAVKQFLAAHRVAPHDPLVDTLVRMAKGATGKSDLFVEGSGALTVDGVRFTAPRHLKLPAGPHAIGDGDHPTELVLRKDEERHLSAE